MKNAAHQYEDKLLEFAYGELPQHEADAVDAHVRGCARCNQALGEIRGVRATMAQLPMEAAPDAGLDSLLAYAEQAAKRNAQGEARPSFFRKFLMPLASVMALATVGVVAWRANQEFDTSPAAAAAELKADEYAARERDPAEKKLAEKEMPPGEGKADAPVAAVPVAAAQPTEDRGAAEPQRQRAPQTEQLKQKTAVPESTTRRSEPRSKVAREEAPVDSAPADDWSNAGKRGGVRDNYSDGMQGGGRAKDALGSKNAPIVAGEADSDLAKAPAAEPTSVVADKVGFGLGSGPVGGLGTGDSSAMKKGKAEAKEAEAPRPQVVTAAPATPPPAPAPKPSKASLSLPSMRGSSTAPSNDEELALEKSDAKRLDDDAKFEARTAAANRTQLLEKARVESNRGERSGEIQLLLQVLKTGATGYEKAEALKRLCDAYEALGQYDTGDRYCDQLLVEFPETVAAKVVTQRRNAQQRAPTKASSKKAADTLPAQAQ